MQKARMKYIFLLCIMMWAALGCRGMAQNNSAFTKQKQASTELPVVKQETTGSVNRSTSETPEEKTNNAEWIYDAQNHRLTIRGTGETHDKEMTEPSDCDCKYHEEGLPYLREAGSWKKQEKIRESIKEVVVEQGITVLNMAAFADLTNLERVTIPDSVEKINDYVFYNCQSLKEITIPDNVTSIGEECFVGCKSLEKISLGKKVTAIGDGNFLECLSLRQITVAPENTFFITKNGALYQNQEKVLCFQYDRRRKVMIEKGTKRIGTFAFADHNKLQEVAIPASVTAISGGSFYRCKNLKKVTFLKGSKCKKIESYNNKTDVYGSFVHCSKLAKIDFPKSLRSIGVYGFMSCTSLKNVRFPEKFRFMGMYCFAECTSLKKIYFGKAFEGNLNYKEDWAGSKTEDARLRADFVEDAKSLKEIQVSKKNPFFSAKNGVMYDKKKEVLYVYPAGKNSTEFKAPKSVRKIRVWAFVECNHLRSIEIFGKKTEIQPSAFWKNANLESVKIHGKKTKIEEEAFYQCKKLKSVSVYGEDSWIVWRAFKRCKNIKSVIVYGKKTMIEKNAFGQSKNFTIYGRVGSEVQLFAKEYKKKFVVI